MATTEELIAAVLEVQKQAGFSDRTEAERFVAYYQACVALEPPPAAPATVVMLTEITPTTEEQKQQVVQIQQLSKQVVQSVVCVP